jgi:hypothetical protein
MLSFEIVYVINVDNMNLGKFSLGCICPLYVIIDILRLYVAQYMDYGRKLSHFGSPVDWTSLTVYTPTANSDEERPIRQMYMCIYLVTV